MRVDIGIVSYNTRDILEQCLYALEEATSFAKNRIPISYTIHVIDNASSDESIGMVKNLFPHVHCYSLSFNNGFARAHNIVFSQCAGDFYILLNPDAFVHENSIHEAIDFMIKTPQAGASGALLRHRDGTIAPSARKFPTLLQKFYDMWGFNRIFTLFTTRLSAPINAKNHKQGYVYQSNIKGAQHRERKNFEREIHGHNFRAHIVDWIPGTFTVVRRTAFRENTLFDERFFMYYEETDMCRDLQKRKWQVWFVPTAEVTHIGGASAMAHVQNKSTTSKHNCSKIGSNSIIAAEIESSNKKSPYFQIDSTGSQLTLWRMQSENIYIYKYSGLFGVFINIAIESTRHFIRIIYHYFLSKLYTLFSQKNNKSSLSKNKQYESQQKIKYLFQAIRNTKFGKISPNIPWQ